MAQTRLRMVLDDESPYADLMLRSKSALFVPDTQRLTKSSYYNYESTPEKEVVEYRIPEIEEFVPGFEFEFKSTYASDGVERWVSHTTRPLFDVRTTQAYLKEGKIRTTVPKPTTTPVITSEYRAPSITEILTEGFELEVFMHGSWEKVVVKEVKDDIVGFQNKRFTLDTKVSYIETPVSIYKYRTKSPKKDERTMKFASQKPQDVFAPHPVTQIPSRKENPIKTNELIQETQCPDCKGIIFYTTEPLCPICEFQGLKHL